MNKLFLTILLFSLTLSAYSQSKTDTENWIANAIKNHIATPTDISAEFAKVDGYVGSQVLFEGSLMSIKYGAYSGDDTIMFIAIEIPIDKISYFSIERDIPIYKLIFSCNPDEKCADVSVILPNGKKVKTEANDFIIPVNFSSFFDDNMPDRFKKAISHLVSLHGGKLKDDTF